MPLPVSQNLVSECLHHTRHSHPQSRELSVLTFSFMAVSCNVTLCLTLLGPMCLHFVLLSSLNKQTNKKHPSSHISHKVISNLSPSSAHLTLITVPRKFQLIRENDLNFPFHQIKLSSLYLQTSSLPLLEKNGFALLS